MSVSANAEILITKRSHYFDREGSTSALENGGWVTAWTGYGDSGNLDQQGIFQRPFDGNGDSIPTKGKLHNVYGRPEDACVTGLETGGWVTVYEADDYRDNWRSHIFINVFDQDGNLVTNKSLRVPSNHAVGDFEMAGLSNGGFVLSWTGVMDGHSDNQDVYQMRFSDRGIAKTDRFRVNPETNGNQVDQEISALDNGGWIVTWTDWQSDEEGQPLSFEVYASVYGKNGEKIVESKLLTGDDGETSHTSDTVELSDGRMLVTWSSYIDDTQLTNVRARIFSRDLESESEVLEVNVATDGQQRMSSVAALKDGGFLVVWESEVSGDTDVFMQRYDTSGQALGENVQVNSFSKGDQSDADVVTLADGSFLVSWTSTKGDKIGSGIFQKRFSPDYLGTDEGETAKGTKISDRIFGNGGDDFLIGDRGDDTLSGGSGVDHFIFSGKFGSDTLTDFNQGASGTEVIDFSRINGGVRYKDLIANADEVDGNLILHVRGGTVKILDFEADDLSRDMFSF